MDGPAVQAPPQRKGFGGRIIEQMVRQLQGEVRLDWRPGGLVCEIAVQV